MQQNISVLRVNDVNEAGGGYDASDPLPRGWQQYCRQSESATVTNVGVHQISDGKGNQASRW